MGYLGNEPADVAVTVGQGVIDASHIQDSSITTADLGNDAVTPNKIDDDGTGFQMGSLGIGASPSFKFDVQDNSGTWASRVLNTNAGGQSLLVRTDATNDATALGVYANGAYRLLVTETTSTFSNNTKIQGDNKSLDVRSASHSNVLIGSAGSSGAGLDRGIIVLRENGSNKTLLYGDGSAEFGSIVTIASAGLNASPCLAIDNSSSSSYIHSVEALGANMTAGQTNIINLGKIGDAKNSGVIGYQWNGAGSNDNLLTFEHWGTGRLVTINGLGTTVINSTGANSLNLFRSNSGNVMQIGCTTVSDDASMYLRTNGVFNFHTPGSGQIRFSSGGSQALNLDASQNATFAEGVAINGASIGSHKLVVDNGTTSLNRGNSGGDILDVRGLNASQFNVTTTATTVGKRFYVTANLDAGFGTELYNAHATGNGTKIRGGRTSAHYSLYVSNNDQTAMNFQVLGDGQCQAGSVMKSPNFRTGRNTTSVADSTWTQLTGLTNLAVGLYTIHAYIADYQATQWSAHGVVEHTGNNTMDGNFQNESGFQLRTNGKDIELYHTAGGTFTIQVSWIKQA